MTTIPLWEQTVPGFDTALSEEVPRLDLYLLDKKEPHPAVIVFPGGGYQRRAQHEGEPVAQWLNSIGLSAFVLHYRVAPYQHPYPLMDAQRAVKLVRYRAAEWKLDPSRIGVLGFSAGGHLASTVGTHLDPAEGSLEDAIAAQSSRPDALILCYPVISFIEHRHEGSVQRLLGDAPAARLLEKLSTDRQVGPETPPTFLWHTANDASVPVENSMLFAAALSRHRIPFDLHVFREGRHGLGIPADRPDIKQWTTLCESWLNGIGWTRS
ncbi:alpha/beta hydrolase [Paenibacillus sp. y28]|uniref:alpha/beta hydrolase n=1 Tax=Paenibacillus sp. y28 TaxID=3129110 RepID=UPI003016ADAC